jgi:alpha-D-ribose 1-methylphosphonate 5-triphosphate synthase subunit PhnI
LNDDDAAAVYTGYAVANPSTTDTVAIKVVTVREDGTVAATLAPVTLTPGQQVAQFFFQDPAASKTFKGTAVLIGQGGRKFSVVALVQNQGLYTAIPVTAGRAPNIN